MTEIKEITAFKATDGEIFTKKIDADKYQADLEFSKWYIDNRLYGNSLGFIDCIELKDWLHENRLRILKLLDA